MDDSWAVCDGGEGENDGEHRCRVGNLERGRLPRGHQAPPSMFHFPFHGHLSPYSYNIPFFDNCDRRQLRRASIFDKGDKSAATLFRQVIIRLTNSVSYLMVAPFLIRSKMRDPNRSSLPTFPINTTAYVLLVFISFGMELLMSCVPIFYSHMVMRHSS